MGNSSTNLNQIDIVISVMKLPVKVLFFLVALFRIFILFVPIQAQELWPKLDFEETLYEFGQIKQQEGLTHRFAFKNSGNTDLVIMSLKSSCGCTAATASTGPYHPGESGFIDVTYDSRAKIGFVYKEVNVYSNDPNSPANLSIQGVVLLEQHPTKSVGDVLFKDSCAECHSIPGKDKTGKKLYDSVCALCHDFPQSAGKPALSGDRTQLSRLSRRELKKIITKGVSKTSMPAFGEKFEGPLTKEQIQSVIEYLLSLNAQKEGG